MLRPLPLDLLAGRPLPHRLVLRLLVDPIVELPATCSVEAQVFARRVCTLCS